VLIATVVDVSEEPTAEGDNSEDHHQAELLGYDDNGRLDRAQLGRQVATLGIVILFAALNSLFNFSHFILCRFRGH
jgi:hypothetical protein